MIALTGGMPLKHGLDLSTVDGYTQKFFSVGYNVAKDVSEWPL
jgi:hypothetical protein